jgi:hypothetical protein
MLFLSSKNGFIPEDFENKIGFDEYVSSLIQKKIIQSEDVVGDCSCMTPSFLEH